MELCYYSTHQNNKTMFNRLDMGGDINSQLVFSEINQSYNIHYINNPKVVYFTKALGENGFPRTSPRLPINIHKYIIGLWIVEKVSISVGQIIRFCGSDNLEYF